MLKRPNRGGGSSDSLHDKLYKYRSVLLFLSVPLLLLTFVFYVMPSQSPIQSIPSKTSYAVIFDAGSSGSRVHVFSFNNNLNLLPIGKDLELFLQTKPGLIFYASNPRTAAHSLSDLLHLAEAAVPKDLPPFTPSASAPPPASVHLEPMLPIAFSRPSGICSNSPAPSAPAPTRKIRKMFMLDWEK